MSINKKSSALTKSSTALFVTAGLLNASIGTAAVTTVAHPNAAKTSCEITLNNEKLHHPELVDLNEEEILDALVLYNSLNPHRGEFLTYQLTDNQKALLEDLIQSMGREKAELLLAKAFERSKEFSMANNSTASAEQINSIGKSYTRALGLVQRSPEIANQAIDVVMGDENILFNKTTLKMFEEVLRKKDLLGAEKDLLGKGFFKKKKRATEAYEQDKVRLGTLHQLELKDQVQLATEIYTELFEKTLHLKEAELALSSPTLAKELTGPAKALDVKLKVLTESRDSLRTILAENGGKEFMIEMIRVSLPTYGKLLIGTRPSRATRGLIYWSTYSAQFATSGLLALATKDLGYLALGAFIPLTTSWVPGLFHGTSVRLGSKIQNWMVRKQTKNLLKSLIESNSLTADGTIINGDYKIIEEKQRQLETAFINEHIASLKPNLSATTNTFEIQKYGEDILQARTILATRFLTETAHRGTFKSEDLQELRNVANALQTSQSFNLDPTSLKNLSAALSRRQQQVLELISESETLLKDTQLSQSKMAEFDEYLAEEIDIYIKANDTFFKTSEEVFYNKQSTIRQASEDLKNLLERVNDFRANINHEVEHIGEAVRYISLVQNAHASNDQQALMENLQQLDSLLTQVSLREEK